FHRRRRHTTERRRHVGGDGAASDGFPRATMSTPDGLTHELVGTTTLIRLTGDIDFVNAREVAMRVEQLCRDAEAVVLDLAAATYLDSAGVWLIDGVSRTCATHEIPFALYVPRGAIVRRVVELTLPTLEIIENVQDWDASRPGEGRL